MSAPSPVRGDAVAAPAAAPAVPPYDPGAFWDEAFAAPGVVRPHYADVMEALAEVGLDAAAAGVDERLRERVVLTRGPVAPVDGVRLGERCHLLDPRHELLVGGRDGGLAAHAGVIS